MSAFTTLVQFSAYPGSSVPVQVPWEKTFVDSDGPLLILEADYGNFQAGLYVQIADQWRLALPQTEFCNTIANYQFRVFLNVDATQSFDAGTKVYANCILQGGTDVVAGTAIWVVAEPFGGGAGTLPLTTKGDLVGFSTVAARLPVGSDNQVLTADSTQPLGIKWAAGGGGGGGGVSTGTLGALLAASPTVGTVASATDSAAMVQTGPDGNSIVYTDVYTYAVNTGSTTPVALTVKPMATRIRITRTVGTGLVTVTLAAPAVTTQPYWMTVEVVGTPSSPVALPRLANITSSYRATYYWNGAAWALTEAGFEASSTNAGIGANSLVLRSVLNSGANAFAALGTALGPNAVSLGSTTNAIGRGSTVIGGSTAGIAYGDGAAVIGGGTAWGDGCFVGPRSPLTTGTVAAGTSINSNITISGTYSVAAGVGTFTGVLATPGTPASFAVGESIVIRTPGSTARTFTGLLTVVSGANVTFTVNNIISGALDDATNGYSAGDAVVAHTRIHNSSVAQGSWSRNGANVLNMQIDSWGAPNSWGSTASAVERFTLASQQTTTATQELFLNRSTTYNSRTQAGLSNRYVTAANTGYLVTCRIIGRGTNGSAAASICSVTYQFLLWNQAGTATIPVVPTITQALVNQGFTTGPTATFGIANSNQLTVTMNANAADTISWMCSVEMVAV